MKKSVNTKKQSSALPQRRQWAIIALLVVILFVFAFFVYAADFIWKHGGSV